MDQVSSRNIYLILQKKCEKVQVTQTKSIDIPSEYLNKISHVILSGGSKMLFYKINDVNNVILIEKGIASILTNLNGFVETQHVNCPLIPPTIQINFNSLDTEQLRCINQELYLKTGKILVIILSLVTYLNIDTSVYTLNIYFNLPRGPTFTLHTVINYGEFYGDMLILLCSSVTDGVLEYHRSLSYEYVKWFEKFIWHLKNDTCHDHEDYCVMNKKIHHEQTYVACAFTVLENNYYIKRQNLESFISNCYTSVYIINHKGSRNVRDFIDVIESYKRDFDGTHAGPSTSYGFLWS